MRFSAPGNEYSITLKVGGSMIKLSPGLGKMNGDLEPNYEQTRGNSLD